MEETGGPRGRYVLADDVRLIGVASMSPELVRALEPSDGDFILSRPGLRTPDRLVDEDVALLLSEFRRPSTIVEAILRFSLRTGRDPEETLESAFPSLSLLTNEGFLAREDSERFAPIVPSSQPGAALAAWVVVRCVRALEDSEVYETARADGTRVALKIVRPGAPPDTVAAIRHEARLLRRVGGWPAATLAAQGTIDGRAYVATEWLDARPVTNRAAQVRGALGPAKYHELLGICLSIVSAYAALHQRGVVHVDVHPGNILIDDAGTITLIDLGRAQVRARPPQSRVRRTGVLQYLEPEAAEIALAGGTLPPADVRSEQYAVALVCYRVITGNDPRNLPVDREPALRRIMTGDVVPFQGYGIAPMPNVERVLRKALSPGRVDRYASMSLFREDLAKALGGASARPSTRRRPSQSVVDRAVQAATSEAALERARLRPVEGSVARGRAGVAWFCYRMALLRDDPDLLAWADYWAAQASTLEYRHASLYHGELGADVVRALVASARGDGRTLGEAIAALLQRGRSWPSEMDSTDVLLGLSLILGRASVSESTRQDIVKVMRPHLRKLRRHPAPSAPVAYAYLLGTHLSGNRSTGTRGMLARVRATREGPGWGRVPTGSVHLWTLADEVGIDEKSLAFAVAAGRNAIERPGTGPWLWRGGAGIAFALLRLFQRTNEEAWLARAHDLVRRSLVEWSAGRHPMSLMHGALGQALLVAELDEPTRAELPLLFSPPT